MMTKRACAGLLTAAVLAAGTGAALVAVRDRAPSPAPGGEPPRVALRSIYLDLPPDLPRSAAEETVVTFSFAGQIQGESTPCGCVKPPQGGVGRWRTVHDEMRRHAAGPVVFLVAGDAFFPPTDERVVDLVDHYKKKASLVADWLIDEGAAVVGLGGLDLALGTDVLGSVLRPRSSLQLLVGNATLPEGLPTLPDRVVKVGPLSVGWVGLVDPAQVVRPGTLPPESVEPPVEHFKRVQARLRPLVDLLVVVADLKDPKLLEGLAQEATGLTILMGEQPTSTLLTVYRENVVCVKPARASGTHYNALQVFFRKGSARFLDLGRLDAYDAMIAGPGGEALVARRQDLARRLDWGSSTLVRYVSIPLGEEIPADDRWKARIAELNASPDQPGPAAVPGSSSPRWVDPAGCVSCHAPNQEQWKRTKHAHAIESLPADKRTNPECLSCHVEGFAKPRAGEAKSGLPDPVGCQSCHGPGEGHPPRKLFIPRNGTTCLRCHTDVRDPKFQYGTYAPRASCVLPKQR